jgi:hypothetical protein
MAAGIKEIAAEVRQGTRRDALLYALSANAEHGHRRTNEDKRRAVDIMLADPEWSKLTDRAIAEACLVTEQYVSKIIRAKAAANVPTPDEDNSCVVPDQEQSEPLIYELDRETGGEVVLGESDLTLSPETYDWDAADLRRKAMDAIRALASLPAPEMTDGCIA